MKNPLYISKAERRQMRKALMDLRESLLGEVMPICTQILKWLERVLQKIKKKVSK